VTIDRTMHGLGMGATGAVWWELTTVAMLTVFLAGCGHHHGSGTRQPTATPSPAATANACAGHVEVQVDGPAVDLDLGYSGVTYDTRFHQGIVLTLAATCADPSQASCTSCTLSGPATTASQRATRRCADDMRAVCTTNADCASGTCVDLLGPPLGLIGGGTASCVRNEIVRLDPGTLDPASGALSVPIALRWTFFEGIDVGVACPRCSGAAIGAAGTCQGGPHDGESCVVDSTDDLLGNTSYDCPPEPVVDLGDLNFSTTLTTGASRLEPDQRCVSDLFRGLPCYCLDQPVANVCDDGRCDAAVGAAGTCTEGPIDGACAHDLFRGCSGDSDCPTAGDHCQMRPRQCSAAASSTTGNTGPLERDGVANPDDPVLVGTFCVPASSSAISNAGLGLPGPAAIRLPTHVVRTE